MKSRKYLLCLLMLSLMGCKQNSVVQSIYNNSKSKYPEKFISHFPEQISNRGMSSLNYLPAGADVLRYWGFQLFINYDDDQQKQDYLDSVKERFIDTTIVAGENVAFLTSIKEFCDSTESNNHFTVYPYPNVQQEIEILNFDVFVDKVSYSKDWNDYKFFLIELKDSIVYEEQKNIQCELLERELKHGFSRGVALNEKDRILFYWLYFW